MLYNENVVIAFQRKQKRVLALALRGAGFSYRMEEHWGGVICAMGSSMDPIHWAGVNFISEML